MMYPGNIMHRKELGGCEVVRATESGKSALADEFASTELRGLTHSEGKWREAEKKP